MHTEPPSAANAAWWRQPLVRSIAKVLAVKIALIFVLWWAFFDLPDASRIDTQQVGAHITGTTLPAIHAPEETLK